MHRMRRKHSPTSLELKNSINTFMARSFFSSLTTNQFWQFSGQRKAFHHWQLLDYSVRQFCSLHANMKFSSNQQRHMPMQMVCDDYRYHTNQIWQSYHTRPHLLSTFPKLKLCLSPPPLLGQPPRKKKCSAKCTITLSKVGHVTEVLKPYQKRQHQLQTVEGDCLTYVGNSCGSKYLRRSRSTQNVFLKSGFDNHHASFV